MSSIAKLQQILAEKEKKIRCIKDLHREIDNKSIEYKNIKFGTNPQMYINSL